MPFFWSGRSNSPCLVLSGLLRAYIRDDVVLYARAVAYKDEMLPLLDSLVFAISSSSNQIEARLYHT